MSRHGHSPRRQRRRRGREDNDGGEEEDDGKVSSSPPLPSPGSWNVDRGRSRVRRPSNPFSEDNLRRRGYHSLLSSFGKVFHVEKRWKLVREMGSGAYGVVISAADEISGETVAIKMVTRVFDKVQLAKRALREITLLRHFSNHENITGLIDVDAISPDFNEIYIFMEPMEADLHQIIKSGQILSNEHVQYFLYQILRGMKFIHSAGVIHRDLKPGNLLVNANCELKICDFGLSRGYDSAPDENASRLTEYVATRWYRAPEIMLAFPRYNTAIDVWSIGCILAELLLLKPLFKGKDYVDQLNKILDVLGSPEERIIKKIGSDRAQAYVRSLPLKKAIPFIRIFPTVDSDALDVMAKMLAFDPADRISVPQALEYAWLSAYHDDTDEPVCERTFERWREIEQLETIEDFRTALWNEIEDYRREVRGIHLLPPIPALGVEDEAAGANKGEKEEKAGVVHPCVEVPEGKPVSDKVTSVLPLESESKTATTETLFSPKVFASDAEVKLDLSHPGQVVGRRNSTYSTSPEQYRQDPVVTYARRSSILQQQQQAASRQGSTFNSPIPSTHHLPTFFEDHEAMAGTGILPPALLSHQIQQQTSMAGTGMIAFPMQPGYIVPARSRTGSTAGGTEVTRKLLRTLSTVSIHESSQGRMVGGAAGTVASGLGKGGAGGMGGGVGGLGDMTFMIGVQSEADAPPSEMPMDFALGSEGIGPEVLGGSKIDSEEEEGKLRKGKERAPLFQV